MTDCSSNLVLCPFTALPECYGQVAEHDTALLAERSAFESGLCAQLSNYWWRVNRVFSFSEKKSCSVY
eukprot:COSAG01_NODE_5807_length_4021_cov_30.092810_2_plen_68_part_00